MAASYVIDKKGRNACFCGENFRVKPSVVEQNRLSSDVSTISAASRKRRKDSASTSSAFISRRYAIPNSKVERKDVTISVRASTLRYLFSENRARQASAQRGFFRSFQSTRRSPLNPGRSTSQMAAKDKLMGDLTIRGVTKESVAIDVKHIGEGKDPVEQTGGYRSGFVQKRQVGQKSQVLLLTDAHPISACPTGSATSTSN